LSALGEGLKTLPDVPQQVRQSYFIFIIIIVCKKKV